MLSKRNERVLQMLNEFAVGMLDENIIANEILDLVGVNKSRTIFEIPISGRDCVVILFCLDSYTDRLFILSTGISISDPNTFYLTIGVQVDDGKDNEILVYSEEQQIEICETYE